MKNKTKRISKSAFAMILSLCMLLSCMTVGFIPTDAAQTDSDSTGNFKGWNIYGKVYFLAPAGFVGKSYVYHSIDQDQTNYHTITRMSLLGDSENSRLYYAWVAVDHSGGDKDEYHRFLAYDNAYNTGNWDLSNGFYTKGNGDGIASNNTYFLFSTASNAGNIDADITKSDKSNRTDLNTKQTLKPYLGTSSNVTTGGTINFSYWELDSDDALKSSATEGGTGTTTAYDIYPLVGTKITLTAVPKAGYELDGWYNGTTKITTGVSGNTYTYWNYGENTDIRAVFKAKSYTITYKDEGDASFSGTHESGYPTTHTYGTATALKTATKNNYTFDGWFTSADCSGTAITSLGATAYTSNITLYAKWTRNKTPLTAPTIEYNGTAASPISIPAKKDNKARLTWAAIENAGSYEVFKDGVSRGITTNLYYDIERGSSYSGAYTVKAIPTDENSFDVSSASNELAFTFEKVQLSAPTVTQNATEVAKGSTVAFALTDVNTDYTAGTDFKYQHSGENNATYADVAGLSWTSGALNTVGTRTFKFKATALLTDYFSDSEEVSKSVKVCASAAYALTGDLVTGTGGEEGWPTEITTYGVNTFVSENVFYRPVTVSGGYANAKHYFRLTNQSNQFTVTSSSDIDMSAHDSATTAVTASVNGTNGAMYVTGNGTFKIYVDQSTSGAPKVWVVSNEWSIATHAYYQTFNLKTDNHNTPELGTQGGTVSGNIEVVKGTSATITAVPNSGYTFDGWYDSAAFTNKVSADASYTFTPAASGDYYALFKAVPPVHYTLTVPAASNVTVTATYNGHTLSSATGTGSLSVPVGASVSYSIVLANGYQLDSTTPSGLSVDTGSDNSFIMPGVTTAVTATVSKITYTLTGAVSPSDVCGNVKFYADANYNQEITTAQIGDVFYAKYIAPSAYYALGSFTQSGTGLSAPTTVSENVVQYTMGYADATITAAVVAATPVIIAADMEVLAGESFTAASVVPAPAADTLTVEYTFQGKTNSAGSFTAPKIKGNYTLTITAKNKPAGFNEENAVTVTKNVTISVKNYELRVTYYVDMHNNEMTGKSVEVAIVDGDNSNVVKESNAGTLCQSSLAKQQSSKVYAAEIDTPIVPVVKDGANYRALHIRLTYNGQSYWKELNSNQIGHLVQNTSKEIWLEAVNESSQDLKLTYSTEFSPEAGSTPKVDEGKRRIYVAKPSSWGDSGSWKNLGVYYWGNNPEDIGWNNGIYMKPLGSHVSTGDGDEDAAYDYYYADIPKVIIPEGITQNETGYKVHSIIIQGWGEHTENGDYTKAQTGNIENIADSDNFFILSKNGNSYSGTKAADVVIPSYARHVSKVVMNITQEPVSIASPFTGADVEYISGDTSKVRVDNGMLTPVASTITNGEDSPVIVTVKVKGTIGSKINSIAQNIAQNGGDAVTYTIRVSVHDPSKFLGFEIMSLESKTYTVNIPKVGNDQPGYFDMSRITVTVTGILGLSSSDSSAIITPGSDTVTVDGNAYPTSFTVQYAKASDFEGYSLIALSGNFVTKSIRRDGGARYGHGQWNRDNEIMSDLTTTRVIDNGVETATTSGIPLESAYTTYSAKFESYDYVDVTFVFHYYEYKPKTENGMVDYPYDAAWACNENSRDENFGQSHDPKSYTVSNYEVRDKTASTITPPNLLAFAGKAIKNMPENNYYEYSIDESAIPEREIVRDADNYKATVHVHMKHAVRQYYVYLNGNEPANKVKHTNSSGAKIDYYAYQEYAEPSVNGDSKWYAVDKDATAVNTATDPVLATGTSYKFRVKGDTYLRTEDGSIEDVNFNRSEVDFSHYELNYETTENVTKEILRQNFYIADFFAPEKVFDLSSSDGAGGHLPYDDATFVGGGVVYYSVRDNQINSNALSMGYVNNNDGTINKDAVKEMLKSNIEAKFDSDIAAEIGDEDAMKLAYGTEIAVTQHKENGVNSGMLYRYLPMNEYKRENGELKKYSLVNEEYVVDNENGTYVAVPNDNTFRYSNTLRSYQYVYASGNENKATYNGRNMRLYSYYVYSYIAYDKETNVPQTKYEIVLSNQYADASTYWGNPAPEETQPQTNS